ncbi:MAG: hypothetical protein KY468_12095 [Armatimonadetes bacterium]|nr:hypothetical protein [Armatimonadota bacterium]
MKFYRGQQSPGGIVVAVVDEESGFNYPLQPRYDLVPSQADATQCAFDDLERLSLAMLADYLEDDEAALEHYPTLHKRVQTMEIPFDKTWNIPERFLELYCSRLGIVRKARPK